MRLEKEDFKKLDELLGKMGFGGYFDLVECIKIVERSLAKRLPAQVAIQLNTVMEKETDLHVLVKALMMLAHRVEA